MAIFRRLFRRPNLNSNMDVNSTKSGRKLFIILALVVIVALGVGAFVVGNNKRKESGEKSQPTQTQSQNGAEQPGAEQPQNQPSDSNSQPNQANNQPPSSQNQAATPPANPATGGTDTVPNTGPEDAYPLIVAAIVLFGWYYVRSRRNIQDTVLNK